MSVVEDFVGGVVDGALKEILRKRKRTRRTRRKSTGTAEIIIRELEKVLSPAKKKRSRKRTTKARSTSTRRKTKARTAKRRTATRNRSRR